ncbi:bifunctional chorismate mutase/prephenate dehydratase [Veillonella sp. AS16]|uniref:bifunctional chorismate mutase/prephenate dehydratase n=1 Tax=Veillonella sp. AS16 TaxID=936589 RepID=UPI0003E297C0|nr:bifunctional chorismate mutase/prephenate dehydratase [Veillonella sp. AS16]ETS92090.1 putative chorismate mutase [Veillonella sp. AS16]
MNLDELRVKINDINEQMLSLFKERMALSKDVAKAKKEMNKAVYDPKRERDILDKVTLEAGPDMDLYARRFFESLFSLSRTYQAEQLFQNTEFTQKMKAAVEASPTLPPQRGSVACAGVFGSNAQMACDRLLPLSQIHYVTGFHAVFDAVESGECEFGVLPIENSSNGSVKEVYDLLEEHKCYIVRGTRLWISHDLLVKKGTQLSDIHTIISHPQALGQCSQYLETLSGVTLRSFDNTARAAQLVAASDDPGVAAIAAPQCAELYNLTPIARNIQNSDNNYTRFICISKNFHVYPGANKISVVTSANHAPGGLGALLTKFANIGVNLTKLESRPIVGHNFEFLFYLDLEASLADPKVLSVLAELHTSQDKFRLLGNYPEN